MRDNNIIQDAINCIKRLDKENTELKVENERLKEEADNWRKLFEQQVKFNAKQQELWVQKCTENHNEDSGIINKYKQTLQEIKRILIINKQELEECLCNDIGGKILELITKAESEGRMVPNISLTLMAVGFMVLIFAVLNIGAN